MRRHTIVAFLLSAAPLACAAQEGTNGIEFRFGIGPKLEPGYFGDEDLDAGVAFAFALERLRFGPLSHDGETDFGLGISRSVRFVGARNADDFSELEGLDDINASLEVGGGLLFRDPGYEVFANLRYGVVGHEALVAEVGADLIYRPIARLTVQAGPRVLFGEDSYAETYFGVSAAESAASSLDAFDANGGLISAGLQAKATYAINADWEVVGKLQFEQFQEDAADSPVTEADDQVSASVVLTRRITFGF